MAIMQRGARREQKIPMNQLWNQLVRRLIWMPLQFVQVFVALKSRCDGDYKTFGILMLHDGKKTQ